MSISTKKRQEIYDKYNGKCAYCGVGLEKGWHIDHIKPREFGGTDESENLNPSCKYCNNYKGFNNLEEYRRQLIKMLNEEHGYLFKSKTKMQVGINMGSITYVEWDGLFYFEKLNIRNGKLD